MITLNLAFRWLVCPVLIGVMLAVIVTVGLSQSLTFASTLATILGGLGLVLGTAKFLKEYHNVY